MNSHRLTTLTDVVHYMKAGNARLTLVSKKTGQRFTYRVRTGHDKPKAEPPWFVSVLCGQDNDNDYQFLGTMFEDGSYRHGLRSRINPLAPSAKAFAWFFKALRVSVIPDSLEVWHEGRCGRCGRTLTVPESIATGIGPECAGKLGVEMVQPKRKRRREKVNGEDVERQMAAYRSASQPFGSYADLRPGENTDRAFSGSDNEGLHE